MNSSTHNPPPVEMECVRAASVGTVACVFNASLRGGMGMQPVSGSGHIQYAGITPGSSEEMRTLALSLAPRAVDTFFFFKNGASKSAHLAAVFAPSTLRGGKSRRRWKIGRDCGRVNTQ